MGVQESLSEFGLDGDSFCSQETFPGFTLTIRECLEVFTTTEPIRCVSFLSESMRLWLQLPKSPHEYSKDVVGPIAWMLLPLKQSSRDHLTTKAL